MGIIKRGVSFIMEKDNLIQKSEKVQQAKTFPVGKVGMFNLDGHIFDHTNKPFVCVGVKWSGAIKHFMNDLDCFDICFSDEGEWLHFVILYMYVEKGRGMKE